MSEIAQQAEETAVENIKVNVEGTMENIEKQLSELKSRIEVLDKKTTEPKVSMIVFSGDLDKVLASFVIATGSVAMGMDVVMFFTFWGTPVLRDKNKSVGGKDVMGKMFGTMLPKGTGAVKLSQMNMGGMGTAMMKSLMKKKMWRLWNKCWKWLKSWGLKFMSVKCPWILWGSNVTR